MHAFHKPQFCSRPSKRINFLTDLPAHKDVAARHIQPDSKSLTAGQLISWRMRQSSESLIGGWYAGIKQARSGRVSLVDMEPINQSSLSAPNHLPETVGYND